MQNGAAADEADTGDDLRGDAGVVARELARQTSDSSVNMAEPKQINMTVRKPVGRCLSSRSKPMAPPRIAATINLSRLEEAPVEIGHQPGSQAASS